MDRILHDQELSEDWTTMTVDLCSYHNSMGWKVWMSHCHTLIYSSQTLFYLQLLIHLVLLPQSDPSQEPYLAIDEIGKSETRALLLFTWDNFDNKTFPGDCSDSKSCMMEFTHSGTWIEVRYWAELITKSIAKGFVFRKSNIVKGPKSMESWKTGTLMEICSTLTCQVVSCRTQQSLLILNCSAGIQKMILWI